MIKPATLALFVSLCLSVQAHANRGANPHNNNWTCGAHKGHWVCHQNGKTGPYLYPESIENTPALATRTPRYSAQTLTENHQALANALGWIPDTSATDPENCSICGGHYWEPPFPFTGKKISLTKAPSRISYDQASYQLSGDLLVRGNVQIMQPNRTLYADRAIITPNKTGHLQKIHAKGHIRLHQPGEVFLGSKGSANLYKHHSTLQDVHYLMRVRQNWRKHTKAYDQQNFTGYAHGVSSEIKQLSKTLFVLEDATYATCPPTSNTWHISATSIHLNKKSERGHAWNTVLHLWKIPVFYWPYLSFPLTSQRQTGFLYGTFGSSSNSGAMLSLPFYINLAPNFDDTFTPVFYSKRGTLFKNQFRYLTKDNQGQLDTSYLHHDRETGANRKAFTFKNTGHYDQNWSSHIDYNYVGDQSFLQDFSSISSAQVANQVLLNRSADLSYDGTHTSLYGIMQSYQVINSTLILANRPYERMPEIDTNSQYLFQEKLPVLLNLNTQFVEFKKNSLNQNGADEIPVEGQRVHIAPQISLPFTASYGFFTPSVTLDSTLYTLQNINQATAPQNGFPDTAVSRNLPIIDIDTGLYFDRTFSLGKDSFTQTIEPHLFYLYVPYDSQSNIPDFDTSITNFGYNSLFSKNRFTGLDRIGDANQISAALSTELDNDKGQDLLDAAIGQTYYFKNRDVSLCRGNLVNGLPCVASEDPTYKQSRSDYAGQMNIHVNNAWNINTNMTYNPYTDELDSEGYFLQYAPNTTHIFNVGYQQTRYDYALLTMDQILGGQFSPPRLSQVTSSFIWKLNNHWGLVGKWNFSLNAKHTIDEFGGIEYNACCWAVRLVVRHYIVGSDPNNPTALNGQSDTVNMFQFELKGLGGTSSAEINSLEASIPGYQNNSTGWI
jgi:LPS-assembly protein